YSRSHSYALHGQFLQKVKLKGARPGKDIGAFLANPKPEVAPVEPVKSGTDNLGYARRKIAQTYKKVDASKSKTTDMPGLFKENMGQPQRQKAHAHHIHAVGNFSL